MTRPAQALDPFIPSKALVHSDRFAALLEHRLPPPVTVEIDLADGFCNHACPHCFFSTPTKASPTFFPAERADSLATELRDFGVRAIEFPGGGEPTTHPKFEAVVSSFSTAGLPMGLVTNGQLYKKAAAVLPLFEWVRISVDAGDAASFKAAHGVDRFDHIVAGVRMLAARSQSAGTQVGVGFLVTPANWRSVRDGVRVFGELGLSYIQFRPASKVLWARDSFERARDSVLELASSASETDTRIVVSEHKWRRSVAGRSFPLCQTSALVGIIRADGRMPFCCLKREVATEELGSILDHSFADVWLGERHMATFADADHSGCPTPCKHDSYNEVFYALSANSLNANFL